MKDRSCRGTDLRLEREARDLSQEEVFRKLRIPLEFIRQIESGELGDVVANTYTIGFAKTYCSFLGRNPESHIADMRPIRARNKGLIDQANKALHAESSERPVWLTEAMMWATIIGIIALGWATYSLVVQSKPTDAANQVQADSIDSRVSRFPMR